MLIGLEAILPGRLELGAEVILPRSTDELLLEAGSVEEEEMLLVLSLTVFEFPNQRRLRALEVDPARLSESASTVEASRVPDPLLFSLSFSSAWVKPDVASADVKSAVDETSTSSASRHHFLRRVYRSQPSWPRRPSFHYEISTVRKWYHLRRKTMLWKAHLIVIVNPAPAIFGARIIGTIDAPLTPFYPAPFGIPALYFG